MRFSRGFKFNPEVVVRLLADALMVNISLLLALCIRFLIVVLWNWGGSLRDFQFLFDHYTEVYFSSSWLLTPVCLIVFATSGFYSRGRSYQSRYKALVIFQAV